MIYAFSVSNLDFGKVNVQISEKFWHHYVLGYLNIIFWKYEALTLRIKKVKRTQATGPMTPKNDEIVSQKSMFRSNSKCISGAEKRPETTS